MMEFQWQKRNYNYQFIACTLLGSLKNGGPVYNAYPTLYIKGRIKKRSSVQYTVILRSALALLQMDFKLSHHT